MSPLRAFRSNSYAKLNVRFWPILSFGAKRSYPSNSLRLRFGQILQICKILRTRDNLVIFNFRRKGKSNERVTYFNDSDCPFSLYRKVTTRTLVTMTVMSLGTTQSATQTSRTSSTAMTRTNIETPTQTDIRMELLTAKLRISRIAGRLVNSSVEQGAKTTKSDLCQKTNALTEVLRLRSSLQLNITD